MVRILSNGEIVPDDDPRVSGSASNRAGPSQPSQRPRQGGVQHNADGQPHHHMPQGSVFDGLNQRLLDAGVPRWNIFSYTVEPIASMGFLLALLFFGFHGLLFAGILFFIVKYSNIGGGGGAAGGGGEAPGPGGPQGWRGGGGGGPPGGGAPGGSDRGRRPGRGWTSGGHRLGRS